MKNGVSLQLQQKQDVTMTAELRQAIELLQLTTPELWDMLRAEVGDNPFLEFEDGGQGHDVAPSADECRAEGAWDTGGEPLEIRDEGFAGIGAGGRSEEGDGWEAFASRETTLQEHIRAQFDQMVKDAALRAAGHYLIEALDDAGYLRIDFAEAAARLCLPEELVDDARALIQTLDPVGIAARDLGECLRLQLHAAGQLDDVMDVCLARLDLVASKSWGELAAKVTAVRVAEYGKKAEPCDEEEVRLAVAELAKCNPKPGSGFVSRRIESVVPDVLVSRVEAGGIGGWKVELNGAAFPRLLVMPGYGVGSMRGDARRLEQARQYVKERQGRAKWLVGALEQRARSTLAVAKALVAAQRQYLEAGAEFMVPLTLREVAEKVGVHESTVSRIVGGKYMQTPFGVVAMRTFFASGVASSGGVVQVASTSVQALISRLVKAEDPKKPLSDEKIVTLLKNEGVEVARRTVAKYRGVLGIPGTAERRVRVL